MIGSASSRYAKKACQSGTLLDVCTGVKVMWCGHGIGSKLTGSVEDVHRTSCPHSTGAQDDRYLCLLSRKNSGLSAPGLNSVFDEATGRCVSHQTLRRRLHDANPHSWRPWWEPRRTPQHHGLRYWWARNHVEWTPQDIGCFLFFSLIPIRQHVPLHFVILHVLVYFNTGWSAYYFIMFYFVIWW